MKKVIIIVLVFILSFSCKKKDETYYPDGSLKTSVDINNSRFHGLFTGYYENGELQVETIYNQGLIQGWSTYYHKPEHVFSKSEVLYRNDTAIYRKNFDKLGKLVGEGFLHENDKTGKWIYYDIEDNYVQKIREIFYIDGKYHLNQNWELNRKGDTIGGNFFRIKTKKPMDLHHQRIIFEIDHLPYFEESVFFIFIPDPNDKQFDGHFLNEKEISQDTIASFVKADNGINYHKNKKNVINVFLDYDTPGEKIVRGIILEKKTMENQDSLDFNTVTRKIYFEKEIFIEDKQK